MEKLHFVFLLRWMLVCIFVFSACSQGGYQVKSSGLVIRLSSDGEIKSLTVKGKRFDKPISAYTGIAGCRQDGTTIVKQTDDGTIRFERTWVHDSLQQSCVVIDQFIPTANSIRWELTVKGKGEPWGSLIQTRIHYPVDQGTTYWTAWGFPQYNPSTVDKTVAKKLTAYPGGTKSMWNVLNEKNNVWIDPLVAVPFSDVTYYYGAPYFDDSIKKIFFVPFNGDIFCIPMATVIEPKCGVGLTFALSPEDEIIDLVMHTSAQGDLVFDRIYNRISADHECRFAMDITAHADDWRPALAWMSNRYPAYFNPVNDHVHQLSGTGAYSNHYTDFDTEKMQKMCFSINWQASFDFPYMGMFLPPVGRDEPWLRFLYRDTITVRAMNDYAAEMKAKGFFVLNYFNVTEFGANIIYPKPALKPETKPSLKSETKPEAKAALKPEAKSEAKAALKPALKVSDENELWKDCNALLYTRFPGAILGRPDACVSRPEYRGATPPEPWHSWEGCIAVDCGDAAYHDFLLDQARRHVAELPDAFGICIDRLDWLQLFNERADDGLAWFKGKRVRSLYTSWKRLMDDLAPVFHDAGKFIWANNHLKRIDILNHVDGIFDEFTYTGVPLNTTALLCINKPASGWVDQAATVKHEGGDAFFHKYLYMGVFPMCPFPGNDHSIQPDAEVDRFYLDYGPLMQWMKSRQWVLEPHVISVENDLAKANIFKIPDGYSIPVVYGESDRVRVRLSNIHDLNRQTTCLAYHPGKERPVAVNLSKAGKDWYIDVPLERGCAMIKLTTK